jgi:hypothetical protein
VGDLSLLWAELRSSNARRRRGGGERDWVCEGIVVEPGLEHGPRDQRGVKRLITRRISPTWSINNE